MRGLREPPQSLIEAKKRHPLGSGTYPGKSKLNEIFVDAGIPYQIASPQNKRLLIDKETGEKVIDPKTGKPKVNNQSSWCVYSTDVGALRSGLEQKREEKRLKREQRKAERQQQEAVQPQQEKIPDPDNPYVVVKNPLKYPQSAYSPAQEQEEPSKSKVSEIKIRVLRGGTEIKAGEKND